MGSRLSADVVPRVENRDRLEEADRQVSGQVGEDRGLQEADARCRHDRIGKCVRAAHSFPDARPNDPAYNPDRRTGMRRGPSLSLSRHTEDLSSPAYASLHYLIIIFAQLTLRSTCRANAISSARASSAT